MNLLKKINLDVTRLIASFMIVAIHMYPFSFLSDNLDYLFTRIIFRIAVPIFLMITGYYVIPKAMVDIKTLKKYTKKILKLYLISILIYLPINIYNDYFAHFSLLTFLKDIFINSTFYHLWYFPALLLGIWITYFLLKKCNPKTIRIILMGLFVIGLFGDSYYGFTKNIPFIKSFYNILFTIFDYTRNGLFYTPIFLYLGYYFYGKENHLTNQKNIILIVVSLILMIIEGLLLHHFNMVKHNSMYIFLLPLSFYTFNFLIYHNHGSNKKIRNMGSYIYILHPLFIVVVRLVSKILHLPVIIQHSFINYLLVLTFTIGFILIMIKGKEFIKNERRFIKRTRMD